MSVRTQNIQGILRRELKAPEESSLWLQATETSSALHCLSCGAFLFYKQHRVVALVQDDMSQVLSRTPLTFQCQKCGHLYQTHIF